MSIIGPFSSAEEWELANPETPYKDSLIAGALQLADTPQQAGDRVGLHWLRSGFKTRKVPTTVASSSWSRPEPK